MTETRCECCDLPSGMCGKAAEKRQRAEWAKERAALLALIVGLIARPDWITAQYPGSCNTCGELFEAGTPITLDRKTLTWRAECCA